MPCLRPFQPISCRYKASKWSLRGSLLIETKCYGIDLFRESCSPYIKAIRACLLNTSEICSTGWSPLVWYKFTADLSTTAVMLLFHLKDSNPVLALTRLTPHKHAHTHAHTATTCWPLTANSQKMGQVAGTFMPHTHLTDLTADVHSAFLTSLCVLLANRILPLENIFYLFIKVKVLHSVSSYMHALFVRPHFIPTNLKSVSHCNPVFFFFPAV